MIKKKLSVIPHLSICPKNSIFYSTDTGSVMLIADLVKIARKWKQLKYPLMNE